MLRQNLLVSPFLFCWMLGCVPEVIIKQFYRRNSSINNIWGKKNQK